VSLTTAWTISSSFSWERNFPHVYFMKLESSLHAVKGVFSTSIRMVIFLRRPLSVVIRLSCLYTSCTIGSSTFRKQKETTIFDFKKCNLFPE
jgi:hypothetical protein